MQNTALLIEFAKQCGGFSPRRWVIGLSGGLDSVVLLHLALRLFPKQQIHVLHINHQLQSAAPSWEQFCANLAQRHDVLFTAIAVTPASVSEADARQARYQAFESFLQAGDVLLLGQHANDQAETLLFRLLRGSGLRGLSGIPRQRLLGDGQLLRPLLSCAREQLSSWARELQLDWVEDPSNQNTVYDRNYLRHRVLPALTERWPQAVRQAVATADLLAADNALLDSYLDQDLAHVCTNGVMAISALLALPTVRQLPLLRHWAYRQSGVLLGERHLEALWQLVSAVEDRSPSVQVGDAQLRRYRDALYCVWPLVGAIDTFSPVEGEYALQGGVLTITNRTLQTSGLCLRTLVGITCTTRQDGMTCRPVGRPEKTLKKLFQEAGIPPWQREYWPVLVCQNTVVAVPGVCVCEGWQVNSEDSDGYLLSWRPF